MQSAEDRFWSKVDASGDCWTWTGAQSHGYGLFWLRGRVHNAHRAMWMLMVEDLPSAVHVDHLCRNRACVNIAHLQPVTPRANARRGRAPGAVISVSGVCGKGLHALGGDNVFPSRVRQGYQQCKACALDAQRAYRARKRQDNGPSRKDRGTSMFSPVKETR